jgi:MFS family permease
MKMDLASNSIITKKLSSANTVWFTLYASVSAFCLYTCIYAFRKTFAVATFDDVVYAGISLKVWLVTAQVIGYALAKFIGIKYISELPPHRRSMAILVMITIAALSWLMFALIPPPFNIIFLFTNGLPLGMVWGLVFGYLEGRRVTEVLGASLAVSFVFSGGLCRSVGGYIMKNWHISEYWMPFVACLVFVVPLLLFLWLLNRIPPPSAIDEQLRTKRQPMDSAARKKFVKTFLPGIVLFVLAYLLLTIFRDMRENFSAEVWKSLGYGNSPGIFTRTETPIAMMVLIVMASMMFIKNNARAFMINHVIIIFGMITIGISTFLFQEKIIEAPAWMTLIGLGLYFGYVPFNSIFFDRLIATFHYVGTVGFIMYVADSFGYLGSVGVLFFKEFSYAKVSWLQFFISSGYIVSVLGTLLIFCSMIYFSQKRKRTAIA